jgi:hypothetical protein
VGEARRLERVLKSAPVDRVAARAIAKERRRLKVLQTNSRAGRYCSKCDAPNASP